MEILNNRQSVQTITIRVLIKYLLHIQISVVRGTFMSKTPDQYKGLRRLASASITLQYIPLKYERNLSLSCFLLLLTALSSSSNNFSLSLLNVSQCKSQLSQYLPSQFWGYLLQSTESLKIFTIDIKEIDRNSICQSALPETSLCFKLQTLT